MHGNFKILLEIFLLNALSFLKMTEKSMDNTFLKQISLCLNAALDDQLQELEFENTIMYQKHTCATIWHQNYL